MFILFSLFFFFKNIFNVLQFSSKTEGVATANIVQDTTRRRILCILLPIPPAVLFRETRINVTTLETVPDRIKGLFCETDQEGMCLCRLLSTRAYHLCRRQASLFRSRSNKLRGADLLFHGDKKMTLEEASCSASSQTKRTNHEG